MEIQILFGVMGTLAVVAIYFWVGRSKTTPRESQ
jgi:hypothetical protein